MGVQIGTEAEKVFDVRKITITIASGKLIRRADIQWIHITTHTTFDLNFHTQPRTRQQIARMGSAG